MVVLWRKLLADLLVYITQTLEVNHSQNYISTTHKVGTIKIYINLFVVLTFYYHGLHIMQVTNGVPGRSL